ncbi:hypothetical protein [Carnimonas bestiolae]|uniref:hypothetical protein n=1 Tax=Carnimonas bestiolae TaxID=3402172 RepID=UPI003F4AD9E0
MRFYGSQEAFQAVHHRVLPWLMLWRLALYAALGWYWLKHFKPRLLTRIADDTAQRSAANQRLRRLEILLIIVLAIIEVSNLVNWAGGASA